MYLSATIVFRYNLQCPGCIGHYIRIAASMHVCMHVFCEHAHTFHANNTHTHTHTHTHTYRHIHKHNIYIHIH